MALSRVQYTGDGTTSSFSVPFSYLAKADIKVSVGGTDVSFSWLSSSTVSLSPAPANGAVIDVRRETTRTHILVDFQDASTLTETELDKAARQSFYLAQESFDQTGSTMAIANDGSYSANARRISGLGYPDSDDDAASVKYVKDVAVSGYDAHEEATKAATSAANAATSETNAASSKSAAATSAANAKTSETNAAASETNAAASATAASTSETNTATSETNAAASADEAAGHAAGVNMPSALGNASKILRQKVDETGFEYTEQPFSQTQADARFAKLSGANSFDTMPTIGTAPIVESGSNTDGSWIRWADGTQETRQYAMTAQTTTEYWDSVTYTTPLAFISESEMHPQAVWADSALGAHTLVYSARITSESTASVTYGTLDKSNFSTSTVRKMSLTITGRWK